MKINLKRAYEPPKPGNGFRVLVDRLWPRGVSKTSARIYSRELDRNRKAVEQLVDRAHTAMLVYGPKDKEHNNAVALKDYLKSAGKRR